MVEVEVRNGNLEYALKKFKQKLKEDGLMIELRRRESYKKPSETRREKRNLAKIREKYRNLELMKQNI